MKKFLVAILFCLGIVSNAVAQDTPKAAIQSTIDALVQVAESKPGDANAASRRSAMMDVITPRFDFAEMAKSSLNRFWKERTPEEQKEFVDVFTALLAKTYLNRIDSIERGMVKVTADKVSGNRGIVKTTVNYKSDVFPIDYRMVQKDGVWRVYDVVIENIGLVANYRNEFAGIIRKKQFSGLLADLKAKVNKKTEDK